MSLAVTLVVNDPIVTLFPTVTVPLIAGSDPMVTELPTVTEEMLMACVAGKLDMLAVTLPICAAPAGREKLTYTGIGVSLAAKATKPSSIEVVVTLAVTVPEMTGRELIVRLFPTVTVPPTVTALARSWVLVRDASEKVTACEAGKFRTETLPVTAEKVTACVVGNAGKLLTVTVPVIAAPTVTVTFSRADKLLASSATVTVLATVTVDESAPEITGADNVTTVGVSVICR
jgi:hypothetical protein